MRDSPGGCSATTEAETDVASPWQRWSWLLGVIWVVFLGFPVAATIVADVPIGWKVVGTTLLLIFAVVYGWGIYRVDHEPEPSKVNRIAVRHLTVMVLLTLLVAPIIGIDAISTLPFIVSLALLSLPLRHGLTVWATCFVVAVIVPFIDGQPGAAFIAGVVALVGAFVLLIRYIETQEVPHQQMADERRLVAERDRVARDVHDVLGHSLTVVTVKLELAERLIDLDPERAKTELAGARSMTRQSLAEVRATVAGLRVARLAEELEHSRNALADAGIRAELPDDPEVVDPRHRIVLAWSLREAVTNVVRHSEAQSCSVAWGPDWLTVTDDGAGLRGVREGNGIRGLRERVRGAGGVVEITSEARDGGTCVRVQL